MVGIFSVMKVVFAISFLTVVVFPTIKRQRHQPVGWKDIVMLSFRLFNLRTEDITKILNKHNKIRITYYENTKINIL